MSSRLTVTKKKEYLDASHKCPYCGSEDISGGFVEVDAEGAWQDIGCASCGKHWVDVYRLVDIEEET